MKSTVLIHSPPDRPVMIFDGDCGFCRFWVRRWVNSTGDRVEFVAYQDPSTPKRFPEIPPDQWEQSVQLIEPDGKVYGGAEAALRALARNPGRRIWQRLYDRFPWFARLAEWTYRFVARNRGTLSKLIPRQRCSDEG